MQLKLGCSYDAWMETLKAIIYIKTSSGKEGVRLNVLIGRIGEENCRVNSWGNHAGPFARLRGR